MRERVVSGLLLAVLLLGGCYPIELDRNAEGKLLLPRAEGFFEVDPASGQAKLLLPAGENQQPVYALWNPAGAGFLAVSQTGGMMGVQHAYAIVDAQGQARLVYTGPNGVGAKWSPDGKYLTVAQQGNEPVAPLSEPMPEILLIDAATGVSKKLVSNVSALHRWAPDSKSLYVFQAVMKDAETNLYSGALVKVDPISGATEKLVSVISDEVHFSLSPDGQRILFTAQAATAGDEQITPSGETGLYALSLADKQLAKALDQAAFALYAPDGKSVLIGVPQEGEGPGGGGLALQVTGADLANPQTVVEDAAASAGDMSSVKIYPTWIDGESFVYLAKHAAFGVEGKNLRLLKVQARGEERKVLQPAVEMSILQALEKK